MCRASSQSTRTLNMRELSLNILDIAQNSVAAGALLTEIRVTESTVEHTLLIEIIDNGKGMTDEQVRQVVDPFFTTRTTRKVGMGIPLFKLAAQQTGGSFSIESKVGEGTVVQALFHTDSIDFTPLGDVAFSIASLVSMNGDKDFIYTRAVDGRSFSFRSAEVKKVLGDVPLSEPSVVEWIEGYLNEQTEQLLSGGEKPAEDHERNELS